MLTEREYRIECIDKCFPSLKGRKVVLYGTGINAKLIIDHAGDIINLIGIVDESQTGRELYGYKVLSWEQVNALHADTLIIAAQISSAITVYNRIKDICPKYNLEIFDLYGNKIKDLLNSIIEINNNVSEQLIDDCFLCKTIKDHICSADIVSLDLKTVFDNLYKDTDLFRQVWETKYHYGLKSFVKLRKRIGEQQEKSYGDLASIYNLLKLYLCLSDEEKKDLMKKEEELRRSCITINQNIAEAIRYTKAQGRKLYFINESILSGSFWKEVLKDKGIDPESYVLLNRSEIGHNKYSGLYREIIEHEKNRRYLHIGNDYFTDGIAASVYGFQSIVITEKANNEASGDGRKQEVGFFENCIQDYCTDNVQYSISDCRFDNFIKLDVCNKYYTFIHNHAAIKPGWLEQLVNTAKENENASIVCSRVSGEDGVVIYAGEVINTDSAVQYAQMVSGYLPEYDYVRNVEQICTASFIVKKDLWDKAEETVTELQDVLLSYLGATKNSMAIYQPLSEVAFMQSSMDIYSLVVDIKTIARPKILVTDNVLTQYDHDAGSRCTWFYLNQFRKLGFDVTLLAESFNEIQPYVMLIQQAGIRVIYGDYYRSNWKAWLKEENDSYRYIYMQRPQSTTFFIDEIRKNCKSAKIFYFAHDLHFLRLHREYEITGNQSYLRESEKSKEQECSLIEAMDVIHVVGSYEQKYLQQIYPSKKIRNIPIYIYDHSAEKKVTNYNPAIRKDLLYVGSFGHPPNLDAVLWFAEHILPQIIARYPDIVWHIVGANPPMELQKYQGKNLVLHGFLSDDELEALYRTCRIAVVPLRYGAGVKGKIIEAAYHQIPIITTPIGAEGISQDEGSMIVCNTADEFADAVCSLYSDEEKLHFMSGGGRKLIENHYTEAAVNRVLSLDIPELQMS